MATPSSRRVTRRSQCSRLATSLGTSSFARMDASTQASIPPLDQGSPSRQVLLDRLMASVTNGPKLFRVVPFSYRGEALWYLRLVGPGLHFDPSANALNLIFFKPSTWRHLKFVVLIENGAVQKARLRITWNDGLLGAPASYDAVFGNLTTILHRHPWSPRVWHHNSVRTKSDESLIQRRSNHRGMDFGENLKDQVPGLCRLLSIVPIPRYSRLHLWPGSRSCHHRATRPRPQPFPIARSSTSKFLQYGLSIDRDVKKVDLLSSHA